MSAVAIAALFVIGGLYIRRHYGGAALAALTLAATAATSAITSGMFLTLLRGLGTDASNAGSVLVIALMVASQALSYGCAAVAIHVMHKDEGSWITAPGFLFALLGYVAGGVLAALIAVVAVLAGAVGIAK